MFHDPIFSIKNFTKIPKTADLATYCNCRYHNKFMEIALFLPIESKEVNFDNNQSGYGFFFKKHGMQYWNTKRNKTKGTLFNTAHAQH